MRSENETGGQTSGSQEDSERSFIERARRAQIMQAAVRVIAERGFARASLARIAQHAGISKGVISYHFAGKGELMEQLVEQTYQQIALAVGPRLRDESAPGTPQWIRTYVTAVAAHMRDHREELAALGEIFANHRTSAGDLRYGVVTSEPLYQALEEGFRRGQECGLFREFDTRVMAVSLQSSVDAMFGYWGAHPQHDLMAHAHELAELFVCATAAPQEP